MSTTAPVGAAPTKSEWWTIVLPTKVRLVLKCWRYSHIDALEVQTASLLKQMRGDGIFNWCSGVCHTLSFILFTITWKPCTLQTHAKTWYINLTNLLHRVNGASVIRCNSWKCLVLFIAQSKCNERPVSYKCLFFIVINISHSLIESS